MIRATVIAFIMFTSISIARADPPVPHLVGIKIWIGSSTLSGYTSYTNWTAREMKKEDATLDELFNYSVARGNFISFFSDPKRVSFPEPMFVSAVAMQSIPKRFVTKFERVAMPLDTEQFYGPYNPVPLLAIELLTRKPLFTCTEKDGWGGIKWASYNPDYNAETMSALCEDPKSEKAEGIRRYLRAAVQDVFELKFHVD